jgi:hypothetical protein
VLAILASAVDAGACPSCGALMRACDVHSAAALAATSKAPLPPELQVAVWDLSDEASTSPKFKRSSKIQRLMQACPSLCPASLKVENRCKAVSREHGKYTVLQVERQKLGQEPE